MRYVIAVDVGIRNLGLCVFDFVTGKFVFWDNVPLMTGKYMPSENVRYVHEFVQRYEVYFSQAGTILIERQMRCNMRIVEAILQAMYYNICVIVNARQVKAHYDLSTRNYRQNKIRAVEWAKEFVLANPNVFSTNLSAFHDTRKQDDLADALLLVCYYLDTYSNQLTSEVEPFA